MKIKTITGLGLLTALVVVLQVISNYIQLPISITLSLIPIVVGAIAYGPFAGAFLGFINGIIILTAPSTTGFFMNYSVAGTFITCLTKTTVAGFIAGLIFKGLKEKPLLGTILASISLPIINTGMFVGYTFAFFMKGIEELAGKAGFENPVVYLFIGFIGINFIIEFAVNSLLSPFISQLYTKKFLKEKNS